MASGNRIRLVRFRPPAVEFGRDAFNAPILVPDDGFDILADYKPVSDAERLAAGERSAFLTARFQVSFNPVTSQISPTWGLTFEGRTFDITGVKEVGFREAIEITANARAE